MRFLMLDSSFSYYAPQYPHTWDHGKNKKQQQSQYQIFECRRKIAPVPDRKDANIIGCRRCQNHFCDEVSFQKSSAKENHGGREDEPCRRDPFHRINHFVVECKIVDQQNRDSRARIQNKRRPAGPAVDSDLVDAQSKEIRAEQAFRSRYPFCVCGHSSGREIIVRGVLHVHESFQIFATVTDRHDDLNPLARAVLECASSETQTYV
jgi:hypothetical protein